MSEQVKANVKSLADVPEALRPFYKEVDGQYAFQVEGGLAEDVAKLRVALEKERTLSATTKAEIEKLKKDTEGLDPEAARKALARLREIEDKRLIEEGKVDELVESRTKQLKDDHDRQVLRFQTDLKSRDDRISALSGTLKKLTIEGGIKESALRKGVKKTAISDVVARMTVVGVKDGIKWDLRDIEGVPTTVALRTKGTADEIVYGKDAAQPMPIDEGLDLLREEADHLFEPSAGTGAANGGSAPPIGGVIRLTREQARDPVQYRAAQAQAAKSGAVVQWPGPEGGQPS